MAHPFILFDLDNTLYPSSSGLMDEIDRRVIDFTARYLNVDHNEAVRRRRARPSCMGTTLQWLRICHGLTDPEPYIEAVHPADMHRYLVPDPALHRYIDSLPADYALFTNSPLEHAERALTALGLRDLFPRIWDLRRMGLRGKPHPEAYRRILGDLGLNAPEALLVDDNSFNLEGFRTMGGQIVSAETAPISQWTAELKTLLGS